MDSKSYYKFVHTNTHGVISSPKCNVEYFDCGKVNEEPKILSVALDRLQIWNMRTRTKEVLEVKQENDLIYQEGGHLQYDEITIVKELPLRRIAVGYQSGNVGLFRYGNKGELEIGFLTKGHRTAVSAMAYSSENDILVSGGDDSDLVVWDCTANQAIYKLRGHKNRVTGIAILNKSNTIISGSKDMLIKIWEMDTQHCIQTIVDIKSEIFALAVDPQETRVVVGCTDNEIRMYNIENLSNESDLKLFERDVIPMQPLFRKQEGRILGLRWDTSGSFFGIHSNTNLLEIYRRISEKRKKKLILKKVSALKQKPKKEKKTKFVDESESDSDEDMENPQKLTENDASVEFLPIPIVKSKSPIRSFVFHASSKRNAIRLAIGTSENSIEEWMVEKKASRLMHTISREGHPNPIRALDMSVSGDLAITCSKSQGKLWNLSNNTCIRTFHCIDGLCSVLFPGNNYCCVGNGDGTIEIVDLNTSNIVSTFQGHHKAIYSMILTPDGRGIVTGGGDHHVKFWNLVLKNDKHGTHLDLEHEHSLQMSDDILDVKISSNATFLTVSLLDSTVKVFYVDSLKFFLSLYGHALPVNCMDISTDETLIITGSSDKKIKIWGLDFGDCHKSIFAHEGPITAVQFVKNTHQFFSCGKDGGIKRFDADTYDCIQILRDPIKSSPLSSLKVAIDGRKVIAAGRDRAIFMYEESDDLMFMEEEKELRLEKEFEKDLPNSQQFKDISAKEAESAHASTRTIETIKYGEKIMEIADVAIDHETQWENYHQLKEKGLPTKIPDKNPLLMNMNVDLYIWHHLKKIKRSELDIVLSVLSYSHSTYILKTLKTLLENNRNIDTEYAAKIIYILLRIHQHTLFQDTGLFPLIYSLNRHIKQRLLAEKETVGFNLAALNMIHNRFENEKLMQSLSQRVVQEKEQYSRQNKKKRKAETEGSWKVKKRQKRNETIEKKRSVFKEMIDRGAAPTTSRVTLANQTSDNESDEDVRL